MKPPADALPERPGDKRLTITVAASCGRRIGMRVAGAALLVIGAACGSFARGVDREERAGGNIVADHKESRAAPTAAIHSMSVRATCTQSLSNAAPSIVHIAQTAMATHTKKASRPASVALAVRTVDVVPRMLAIAVTPTPISLCQHPAPEA
jgi:hypothetical protein